MFFCAAWGCSNKGENLDCKGNVTFHSFPLSNAKLLSEWIASLNLHNFQPSTHSKLCSEHFDLSSFSSETDTGQKMLKPDAIPTKFSFDTNRRKKRKSRKYVDINSKSVSDGKETMHCETNTKRTRKKCHVCEVCKKGFINKSGLARHIGTHSEQYHMCNICNMVFRYKKNIDKHLLIHNDEKVNPIDGSPNNVLSMTQVINFDSNKKYRRVRKKAYSCDMCNKSFIRRTELQRHLGTHLDQKDSMCNFCDKRFLLKANLKKHLSAHLNETSDGQKLLPICKICNKHFSDKANLRKHQLIHKEERAFACYLCDKTFTQKVHLDCHLVHHTGIKVHTCCVCNNKFSQKAALRRHLLIHTGEKPCACNVCHKRFPHSWHLRRHMFTHTLKELTTG